MNADEIERTLRAGALDLEQFDIAPDPYLQERLRNFCLASGLLSKTGQQGAVVDALQLVGPHVSLPDDMVNAYVAGTLADFIRHELLDGGATFTFETVMSSPDKADFMAEALQRGYRTYLYFVGTSSPDINVDRVAKRVQAGGHPVPVERIRERYGKSLQNLEDACASATRAYGEIPGWLGDTSLIRKVVEQWAVPQADQLP
ncbi:zeta toxin family protein [Ramlibacter sp.]|uniref:zeta toxin family protein n=1 Tax=Ramlibacter sp. TaxID=1917967 RepID=UPI0017C1CC85|nr:zeta toxin family protein [Ramlibacter sp.]MBA2676446.1 zeta toxin family protein [Ramlibacter sp.]